MFMDDTPSRTGQSTSTPSAVSPDPGVWSVTSERGSEVDYQGRERGRGGGGGGGGVGWRGSGKAWWRA
jgi:hypothetical protein